MQEQMKARLEELKESELSKKGKDAFETVKNDKQTQKVRTALSLRLIHSLWKKERR